MVESFAFVVKMVGVDIYDVFDWRTVVIRPIIRSYIVWNGILHACATMPVSSTVSCNIV